MKEYTVKVFEDGSKTWYLDGQRHREDGPAVEFSSGTNAWYLNGNRLTEEEHKRRTSGITTDDTLKVQEEVERLRAKKKQIYEDLKDAVEALEFLVAAASGEGPPVPERELLQDCVDKARAAIAKAKGD